MNRKHLPAFIVAVLVGAPLAWWALGSPGSADPESEPRSVLSRSEAGGNAQSTAPMAPSIEDLASVPVREDLDAESLDAALEVEFLLVDNSDLRVSIAEATVSVEGQERFEFLSLRAGEAVTKTMASRSFELLSLAGEHGTQLEFATSRMIIDRDHLRVRVEPVAVLPWRIEVVAAGSRTPVANATVELFSSVDVRGLGAYQYMLEEYFDGDTAPSPDAVLNADRNGVAEIPKAERSLLVRVSAQPYETFLGILETSQTRTVVPLDGRGSLRVTLPSWALDENFRLRVQGPAEEALCDVAVAGTGGTHVIASVAPGTYTCEIVRPSSLCIGRVAADATATVIVASETHADLTAAPKPSGANAGAIIIASFDKAPDLYSGLQCTLSRLSREGEYEPVQCERSSLMNWERDAQHDAKNYRLMLPDIEPGHYLATLAPLGVSASFEAIDGQSAEVVIDATSLVDLTVLADWGSSMTNDQVGVILWHYADDPSPEKSSRAIQAGQQITIPVRPGVVEVQVAVHEYEAKTVIVDCSVPGEDRSVTVSLDQLEAAACELQLLGTNGQPLALSMEQWGKVRYRKEGTDQYSFKKSLGSSSVGVFDPTYCKIFLVDGVRYEIELPALEAEGVNSTFTRFVTADRGVTRTAVAIPGS